MGLRRNITKSLRKLPGIRKPRPSNLDIKRRYLWTLPARDKQLNLNTSTYFKAGTMPWIRVCRRVIKNRVLGLGFNISDPSETTVNQSNVHYLTNLFNHPMGMYSAPFFETYIVQMWDSFLVPGDAFARVHTDEVFDNVPNGLEFLPFEWMTYYKDTDQWGLKFDIRRFEDDEIIHFAEPGIRGEHWGTSLIDSLAEYLTLQIYGLQFNRKVFENDGLNPNGVLSYSIDIDPDDLEREIERLEEDKKRNPDGTLIVQGAEYIQANTSNKEMQYVELEQIIRDITLSVYGVTPAEAGIIESGNLGGGTGESQKETVKNNLTGWLKLFEGCHNKVLGRHAFEEIFRFNPMDIGDQELKANIEDKQLRNGTTYVNEVRARYGLEPVEWGDTPITYGSQSINLIRNEEKASEVKALKKALTLERLNNGY